jgi:hypothetical protein
MQMQGNMLFVGLKINAKLRELLDASAVSMKAFFEQDDPEFLRILQIGADEYIGKVIESGTSYEALGNVLMNVKTMLKMICPTFTPPDGAIRVFALHAEEGI